MNIEHVAIWTDRPEVLREYYTRYFGGKSGPPYHNPQKQFRSYFLDFGTGSRLEIMTAPGIPVNLNDTVQTQHQGIIHLAFAASSDKELEAMARRLSEDGFPILDGPRRTGDGYYEFVTLDPDQNRIEVTATLDQNRIEVTATLDQNRIEVTAPPDQNRIEVTAGLKNESQISATDPRLDLQLLPTEFAICRLDPGEGFPGWAENCAFVSMTRTEKELSVVCPSDRVPAHVHSERGWRAFRVKGPLEFELTGILSSLSAPLAEQGISVFAISTFDTDYLLVKAGRVEEAAAALHPVARIL